jgi:hypothetical protein
MIKMSIEKIEYLEQIKKYLELFIFDLENLESNLKNKDLSKSDINQELETLNTVFFEFHRNINSVILDLGKTIEENKIFEDNFNNFINNLNESNKITINLINKIEITDIKKVQEGISLILYDNKLGYCKLLDDFLNSFFR